MESFLDDADACRRLDKRGMLEAASRLPEQLELALSCAAPGRVARREGVDNVLVCGMGGSAIGGDLVKAWLGPRLSVPLQIHRGPLPPAHIGPRSLVVACSCSGDTRETLEAFSKALQADARIVCLSCGGRLEQRARENRIPFVRIPAGLAPRAAVAFTTVPIGVLLHQAGLAPAPAGEVRKAAAFLKSRRGLYAVDAPIRDNPAKQLAMRLRGRVPVIYGSLDRLSPVAARWAGQFSENAKQLSFSGSLPEMTHNDVVGWKRPAAVLERMTAVFLRDRDDPPPIGAQADLLVRQFGSTVECAERWTVQDAPWPARLWDLLWLGDHASLFLAFLNGEDPTPVEAIDRLKKAMEAAAAPDSQ